MAPQRGFRIGIDTGGTFTDVVGVRSDTGQVFTTKTPTTPSDYSVGLIQGIRKILQETKIRPGEVTGVFHGTTVATNAILERRFENLGLVVTAGFRHLLELGRAWSAGAGRRGSHFATPLLRVPPEALVPPERVREARERVSAAGEVLQPLSPEEAAEAARWFRERNIGSVGICLLHAYANPRHELLLRDAFAREFPECFVSVSSEVIPEPGEYERAVTTLLDACIKPRIKAYLDRSAGRIEEALGEVPFLVMKSNGGVSTAREVAKKPIGTVLSGPAAGALSAAYLGRLSGHGRLITLDGGGTSTDISVIEAGETKRASRHHLDEFVLRLPMVDVVTIGTGGGSIAWRSPEGRLRVGPRSAGADPGPICCEAQQGPRHAGHAPARPGLQHGPPGDGLGRRRDSRLEPGPRRAPRHRPAGHLAARLRPDGLRRLGPPHGGARGRVPGDRHRHRAPLRGHDERLRPGGGGPGERPRAALPPERGEPKPRRPRPCHRAAGA
ncbi:MAG: hydantoinase/oxoprolinase family protein [Candidatus Tectomicrobia bacterium]|nr:hydantoinase/oxoprolinase family protein [Candidatus Tectomicrobia bacterium]